MTAAILLAPTILAQSLVPPTTFGWDTACGKSPTGGPCKRAPDVEGDGLIVHTAEVREYRNETRRVNGTLVVEPGGVLIVDNATLGFVLASQGIVVQAGGAFHAMNARFTPAEAGSPFALDLAPTSTFRFEASVVNQGSGVKVATEDVVFRANTLQSIPLALHLLHVSVTIDGNQFLNNTVAVNQTGGFPTLTRNTFVNGDFCVRDWRSDPTITFNRFRGCHTGIWHEQSESTITDNWMDDEYVPPGSGITVIDTQSPIIARNDISRYGTGITLINARAYIRDNHIHDNVGDGVHVERNSLAMDITANDIHHNGGDGIELVAAHDIPISGNRIYANGGDGVRIVRAANVTVTNNDVSGNAGSGMVLDHSRDIVVDRITALGNGVDGVRIVGGAANSLSRVNASSNARNGFSVDGEGATEVVVNFYAMIAMSNGNDGLFSQNGNAVYARESWWQGNARAGVENADARTFIVIPRSYWGHPSGPTATDNPLGRGDRVIGNVVYQPFLTAPPAETA